jgi:pyrimidine operon attenuation protein/uracil phosphoribosyltransferase
VDRGHRRVPAPPDMIAGTIAIGAPVAAGSSEWAVI